MGTACSAGLLVEVEPEALFDSELHGTTFGPLSVNDFLKARY